MKKIGVLLSGCGVQDGSEIHEAVLTLLALDRLGVEAVCLAPNVEQRRVIDHLTGKPREGERRNVLHEAARIARGKIRDAATVHARELHGLILPGGFGAATNLCDFATAGADAQVHPEVVRIVREVQAQKKPLGFICIAPAVAAAIFRGTAVSPRLTIGDDADTAAAIEKMGATHVRRSVSEIEVDEANRIVSTPAYMLAGRISEAAAGIDRLVEKVVALAG
jgi:enhancing lycopene biosynthesis protein 2